MSSVDPSHLRVTYQKEFVQGLDLFQKSLVEYQKTEDGPKKQMFKKVMDEALQVMNETAKMILNKQGQKHENALENDYSNYIADGSKTSFEQLNKDIANLKRLF